MIRNKYLNIEVREGLKKLPDNSIDCVITSPPYWSLRDYGIEAVIWDEDPECEHEFGDAFCFLCGAWKGCLGLEPTFELYIKHIADIFDGVKRVLKKTGTLFLNLGDSKGNQKGNQKTTKKYNKCLLMIPQRIAIEMINRGWILRNVIIWYKPNCMPESAKDRFTRDFEYVYFFVKNKKYWFDQDAVRERNQHTKKCGWVNYKPKNHRKYKTKESEEKHRQGFSSERTDKNIEYATKGRNKRCVWSVESSFTEVFRNLSPELQDSILSEMKEKGAVWKINTVGNPEAHFATFPMTLVKPMIKAGCPSQVCTVCGKARERIIEKNGQFQRRWSKNNKENSPYNKQDSMQNIYKNKGFTDCGHDSYKPGIVLDPFLGSGTTALAAHKLRRDWLGFEISKDYCKIIKKRLEPTKIVRLDAFF